MDRKMFVLLWKTLAELEALKADYAKLAQEVRGKDPAHTIVEINQEAQHYGFDMAYLALQAWLESMDRSRPSKPDNEHLFFLHRYYDQ